MTSRPQNGPQAGASAEVKELRAARLYLRKMLDSDAPVEMIHTLGRWDEACRALHAAHTGGGRTAARQTFVELCKDTPLLVAVVAGDKDTLAAQPSSNTAQPSSDKDALTVQSFSDQDVPVRSSAASDNTDEKMFLSLAFKALPAGAVLAAAEGATASPWLDMFVAFSKKWSPRGYEGFHEAVGLWVLSTIAARRVMVPLGEKYYTPMFIVLVGRTGLFAKSTTAKVGRSVLSAAGVDWLLIPDDITPQKFISELAGRLPKDFLALSAEDQEECKRQLAFSGQRGWFYDEFGQIMSSILRDGFMSDFRGILRRLDDCYARYAYATISRGTEVVENPYLALLGSMTPDDLGKAAKSGSSLWGDGFLARFAFVTPPIGVSAKGRFPEGLREVPNELAAPLRAWHKRLGVPEITIEPVINKKGQETGDYHINRAELPACTCQFAPGVIDAYYTYSDALTELCAATLNNHDLDGSYNRFASKALRIAMLLASLENDGYIEMRHWVRGQTISERWRANLHDLFAQANEAPIKEGEIMEEKILQVVARLKLATVRELKQYIRGIDIHRLYQKLQDLVEAKVLEEVKGGKTLRYRLLRRTLSDSDVEV